VTILRAATVSGVAVALLLAAVPGAGAAGRGMAATPVRGMDISAYQHGRAPINWALLAREGVRFVSIKVSEGTYYLNPYYQSDARAAAAAGLWVMPYVFANPGRGGGTATANYAVKATGGSGAALLPLVVDLENNPYANVADCYGLKIPAMTAWIARFTARARVLTGKWPVIYTTAAWWRECTGSTGRFRRDALWLAAFGRTQPTVPTPWLHWTFWQYTNGGFLPGVGQTDLDYYQPTSDLPTLRPPAKPRSHKKRAATPKPKTPKPKPAGSRTPKSRTPKPKHRHRLVKPAHHGAAAPRRYRRTG
jgi:GH25 family lysozyme M1 (1,4-beta-N-acetylmuramidase)